MTEYGVWQSLFAIVFLAAGIWLARQQRALYDQNLRRSKLCAWLCLFALTISLVPVGFYLANVVRLDVLWAALISGGLALGPIIKTVWGFVSKQKQLPDMQKALHRVLLCLLSLSLGFASEVAWRSYNAPPPKHNPPPGPTRA
jgi:hypothetical protein